MSRIPLAIACVALAWAAPMARQSVFRAATDAVVVDVSVRQRGAAVAGLTRADFALTDNGAVQTLIDVTRELLPIDVELIVDISASIDAARYTALVRGIEEVRGRLRPADRARVVTFNQRIRETGIITPNRKAFEMLGAVMGSTSLYDAIVAALIRPLEMNRRHMAIVFTDGWDVSSLLGEADAVDAAARSGVTVFSVSLNDGNALSASNSHHAFFERLADATGGIFTSVQRSDDLSKSFIEAIDEFGTSYVLRYAPTDAARGWHDIGVRVTRPGRYDVRARKGYFGEATTVR